MPSRVRDSHLIFAVATSPYQVFVHASIIIVLAVMASMMGAVAALWIQEVTSFIGARKNCLFAPGSPWVPALAVYVFRAKLCTAPSPPISILSTPQYLTTSQARKSTSIIAGTRTMVGQNFVIAVIKSDARNCEGAVFTQVTNFEEVLTFESREVGFVHLAEKGDALGGN
jgi:hypothetical protein